MRAAPDSFVAIGEFGCAKEKWLKTFLDLPYGIPSHDTIGRIFGALNPDALGAAFRQWVAAVARLTRGEVVAIDGKTLRRSFREAGTGAFVHMVSAWATSNRVVLGQVETEEKSNEITVIPRLLKLLQIKGCLVTIDAMGCQKEIAKDIVDAGADYMDTHQHLQARILTSNRSLRIWGPSQAQPAPDISGPPSMKRAVRSRGRRMREG